MNKRPDQVTPAEILDLLEAFARDGLRSDVGRTRRVQSFERNAEDDSISIVWISPADYHAVLPSIVSDLLGSTADQEEADDAVIRFLMAVQTSQAGQVRTLTTTIYAEAL